MPRRKDRTNPNQLLVEGKDDEFLIPYLMDNFVVWGDREEDWPVQIESFDGVKNLLKPAIIRAELKRPGLKALGIIVDADDQRDARWATVAGHCRGTVSDFPDHLPAEGLIHQSASGLRVGVWIMPDNQSVGMLETFLREMVPADQAPLWAFAQRARAEAKSHGATYSEVHRDKADIHTHLAWLDPPGQQLHTAMYRKALDARTPLGLRFARWFVGLFGLAARDAAGLAG